MFSVQGSAFRVQGSRFRVQGSVLVFGVQRSRVWILEFSVSRVPVSGLLPRASRA